MRKALVLSDIHLDKDSHKILKPVEKYMADEKFDYLIYLGDILNLDCISQHNKDKLRKVEGKRILAEYELANEMLDRHQDLVGKSCEVVYILGNHENRIERYIDANPSLEGMIEVSNGLRFKERVIKEVRCYPDGEIYKIGKLAFHHGLYTSSNPAKKMVENFGVNIMFGHLHTETLYTTTSFDKKQIRKGFGIGALCNMQPDYMGRNPSKWSMGFGVVYFQDNGDFNAYQVSINNGGFISPEGVQY